MVSNTLTGGLWKVWELIWDWKPFKFNLTFESATYACWATRPFCLLKNWQIFVVFTLIKYCSCLINYHELNCRIMWLTFLKLEAFLIQFDIWKFYLHSEPHTPSANWKTCKWLMFFRLLKLTLLTQTWTPMVSNTLTGGIWKVWELICDWKPFKFNLTFESATCLLKNWQIFVVFTLIKYCSCLINYHKLNCRIMRLTFLQLEAF